MKIRRLFIFFFSAFFGLNSTVIAQTLFKDLQPGNVSSNPHQFMNVNGTMYFVTHLSSPYTYQLWKSDGTEPNTVIEHDNIVTTSVNDAVYLRASVGDTLYYTVNIMGISAGTTTYLWKTWGDGPVIVDTLSHPGQKYPTSFTVLGNKIFFTMGKDNGRELWVSNGTEAGTMEVVDLAPGYDGVSDQPMVAFNGKVYFQGNINGANNELYSSDGTPGGTGLVKEINPMVSQFPASASNLSSLIVCNNVLYFYADDGTNEGIWKSDGTEQGTELVSVNGFNGNAIVFNNELFYSVGIALWKTDGTDAGTQLVMDSAGYAIGRNDDYFYTQYLRFIPTPPYYTPYYWRSDGTTAGTTRVSYDVGASASFQVLDNVMYQARVDSGTNNMGIWSTDGTDAGTTNHIMGYVNPPFVFNNSVFFSNHGSGSGYELWWLTPDPLVINEETDADGILNIYPNPASGRVNIQWSGAPDASLQVFNILGEEVMSQTISKEIDLNALPGGIYFVNVYDGAQRYSRKISVE